MFFFSKIYNKFSNFLLKIDDFKTEKIINSRGLKFRIKTKNWITKYRANSFNEKEPELLDWLDNNLKNNDIFFDIGANIGIYSIYAALRNPSSKVYAFEPEYSNLDQLKFNIIKNNLQNNITPFSLGISNINQLNYLNIQDYTEGSALHTVISKKIELTQTGHKVIWREGIATYTLDKICEKLNIIPNLMKIDVDGNEFNVLDGHINALRTKI